MLRVIIALTFIGTLAFADIDQEIADLEAQQKAASKNEEIFIPDSEQDREDSLINDESQAHQEFSVPGKKTARKAQSQNSTKQ